MAYPYKTERQPPGFVYQNRVCQQPPIEKDRRAVTLLKNDSFPDSKYDEDYAGNVSIHQAFTCSTVNTVLFTTEQSGGPVRLFPSIQSWPSKRTEKYFYKSEIGQSRSNQLL